MKQIVIITAALASAVEVAAFKRGCLYCRKRGKEAAFMETYDYCEDLNECLLDKWNYLDYICPTEWFPGADLSLEFCEVEEVTCPEWISTPEKEGVVQNFTWALPAGSSCNIVVDGS